MTHKSNPVELDNFGLPIPAHKGFAVQAQRWDRKQCDTLGVYPTLAEAQQAAGQAGGYLRLLIRNLETQRWAPLG